MKNPPGRFILIFVLAFFLQGDHRLYSQGYEEEMQDYRSETIRQLWQSERQPIMPEDTIYLNYFPINADYRNTCELIFPKNPKPFKIATYSGQQREYILWATAVTEIYGSEIRLEIYRNYEQLKLGNYTDYLFLPFKDATNGNQTYGGGRYMNLSIEQIEKEGCFLDFNKAYNPWCAYRDGFNCPIPPRANHLEIKIEAGEKNFSKAN